MTVTSDRLAATPNSRKVVLLEMTAGMWIYFWQLAAGKTYTWEFATGSEVDTQYGIIESPGLPGGMFEPGWAGIPAVSFEPSENQYRIVDLKENGISITEQISVDDVEANPGSWYWSQVYGKLYVHPTGSTSPYTKTLQAIVAFFFATEGRVYNGIYYEPRISSLPTLSIRVEKIFGDPGQIGAGSLTLLNGDGYFDALSGLQWDAGRAILKLGVDGVNYTESGTLDGAWTDTSEDGALTDTSEDGAVTEIGANLAPEFGRCLYEDFDTIGTWAIKEWEKNDTEFTLKLEEVKGALKKKIPLSFYSRDDYPDMEENKVGDPIPIGYGYIYDIRPTCIHLGNRRFKVTGHAIKDFIGARVRAEAEGDNAGAWYEKNFEYTYESLGEFTLAAADWDGNAEVAVDFMGRMASDGSLMTNASDVIKDLITVHLSEPGSLIDDASFLESYVRLMLGTDTDLFPVHSRALSVYIDDEIEAAEVISRINAAVGSYLFNGHDGKYRFKVFEPEPSDSVETFTESDIFHFEETTDATEIISKVRAEYQYRAQQNYSQVYFYERVQSQYLRGAAASILRELEKLPLSIRGDAAYVAQRTARMEGVKQTYYSGEFSAKAWSLLPGDFIRVVYARHGINAVLEVVEVKKSLDEKIRVTLVLGDLHGLVDGILFLTEDSPVFPDSLGGGSASAWDSDWTEDQKSWARQNIGYITDDNGFADPADPYSFMAGIVV